MSACIGCLRTTLRTTSTRVIRTRTTATTNSLFNSTRNFSTPFSPSFALQKKRNAAAEEFEEFEEDIIEDGQEEESSSTPLSTNKQTSTTPLSSEKRHQQALEVLNEILSKSSYALKSFIPSYSLVTKLLEETRTTEELESTLEVIKKWRLKGFKIPEEKMKSILILISKLNVPEVGIDVLKSRTLYGVDLISIRDCDGLLHKLTVSNRMEGVKGEEAKPLIDDCFSLLQQIQFTCRETGEAYPDLYASILTAKFCLERLESTTSPRVYNLLNDIKELGEENIFTAWSKLTKRSQNRVAGALRFIVADLSESKNEKDAELLKVFRIVEMRINEPSSGKVLRDLGMI